MCADVMAEQYYRCVECGYELDYQTTKHNGCPECGFIPQHGAD